MNKILNMATGIFLVVLSADLLYLYHSGYWYDPIRAIEIVEVCLLYFFIGLGILAIIRGIKCLK